MKTRLNLFLWKEWSVWSSSHNSQIKYCYSNLYMYTNYIGKWFKETHIQFTFKPSTRCSMLHGSVWINHRWIERPNRKTDYGTQVLYLYTICYSMNFFFFYGIDFFMDIILVTFVQRKLLLTTSCKRSVARRVRVSLTPETVVTIHVLYQNYKACENLLLYIFLAWY